MKSTKVVRLSLLASSLYLAASVASAQFAKPEDAVKYRQAVFTVMGQQFGRIGAMAQGKVPFNAKAAQDAAEVATMMSKLPWEGFVAGTATVGNTRAKEEIWTNAADFKKSSDKLVAEMAKVNAAAKTGNLDNIKAVIGDAGDTCKACHDDFRKKQ